MFIIIKWVLSVLQILKLWLLPMPTFVSWTVRLVQMTVQLTLAKDTSRAHSSLTLSLWETCSPHTHSWCLLRTTSEWWQRHLTSESHIPSLFMTARRVGSQIEVLSCYKASVTPTCASLMAAFKSGRLKVVKFAAMLLPQLQVTLVMHLSQVWWKGSRK